MNLNLVSEVWHMLNYFISTNDRDIAATSLVDHLIDNNYSVEEINSSFKGEREIIKALEAYDDDLEYDDDDSYDHDDWNENE